MSFNFLVTPSLSSRRRTVTSRATTSVDSPLTLFPTLYTTPLEETQSFADSIYTNLTIALHDFPALATRLGCDPLAVLAEREAENLMAKLTPLQRQRLARRLMDGDAESDGQGVA